MKASEAYHTVALHNGLLELSRHEKKPQKVSLQRSRLNSTTLRKGVLTPLTKDR